MIIRGFAAILCCVGFSSFAQNRIFLNHVHEAENYFYNTDISVANSEIDLMNFDADHVSALAIKSIQHERTRRFKPEIIQDSLLNRIARSAVETFNKRRFTHSRTWYRERRNIKYALQREQSDNKLYVAHAFVLDMLDLKFAESFYPNTKIGTSATNLYLGKIPEIVDPASPDFVDPIAVKALSEELFCQRLIKFLSKGMYRRDMLSKKFSRIGIAVKIDKTSLNRNVRPQLFVILIFGGKQLQQIDIPEAMKSDSYTKVEAE